MLKALREIWERLEGEEDALASYFWSTCRNTIRWTSSRSRPISRITFTEAKAVLSEESSTVLDDRRKYYFEEENCGERDCLMRHAKKMKHD